MNLIEFYKEFIGKEVCVNLQNGKGIYGRTIKGKITDINVDTFHFDDSWEEPVHITVDIDPIGELPKNLTDEELLDLVTDIPLQNVVRC